MITLVLDGYNVIHAVPEFAQQLDRSLHAAREALVEFCQAYRTRRGDIQRLYVVFDGDDAYAHGPSADRGGVTVLFTRRQEEADDRILRVIRDDGGRSRFVIVSNDTYIFNNARAHGARMMSVKAFSAQLRLASAPRAHPSAMSEERTRSGRDAQQITAAYRQYLETKRRA